MAGRILTVLPKPVQETRFRYETEKETDWIYCDKDKKVVPEIKINYEAYGKPMVFVVCFMQDVEGDFPHVHRVATTCPNGSIDPDSHVFKRVVKNPVDCFKMKIGVKVLATQKNKGNREIETRDFTKRCEHLHIEVAAAKETLKRIDRSKVRLSFRLYDKEEFENPRAENPRVLSQEEFLIVDSSATERNNYEIQAFQPRTGLASGGQELIIVCGKVTKDNAMVCLRDPRNPDWKFDFQPDGIKCRLFSNTTFVISDVPSYHDNSGGEVEISVQHIKAPKGKPKETSTPQIFRYTSTRGNESQLSNVEVMQRTPTTSHVQRADLKTQPQQAIPALAGDRTRSSATTASRDLLRKKGHSSQQPAKYTGQTADGGGGGDGDGCIGGVIRTRSMISSSLGSGNPNPRKKVFNEASQESKPPLPGAAPFELGNDLPVAPFIKPSSRISDWQQRNEAWGQGRIDFPGASSVPAVRQGGELPGFAGAGDVKHVTSGGGAYDVVGGRYSAANFTVTGGVAGRPDDVAGNPTDRYSVEETECPSAEDLELSLARFYEEITSRPSQIQQQQDQLAPQHSHPRPFHISPGTEQQNFSDGGGIGSGSAERVGKSKKGDVNVVGGDDSAAAAGTAVEAGSSITNSDIASVVGSMSDKLSDLSLGLSEGAKESLDRETTDCRDVIDWISGPN